MKSTIDIDINVNIHFNISIWDCLKMRVLGFSKDSIIEYLESRKGDSE